MYIMPYNNYFDDLKNPIDDLFEHMNKKTLSTTMTTDIIEEENNYKLIIDIPGIKKEDIKIELDNGYLKISTSSSSSSEEKDKDGKCIRKERYSGYSSRSFYVGDKIKHDDIKAKIENGTLILNFPKINEEPQKRFIEIE